jgi:hypothetical protein
VKEADAIYILAMPSGIVFTAVSGCWDTMLKSRQVNDLRAD